MFGKISFTENIQKSILFILLALHYGYVDSSNVLMSKDDASVIDLNGDFKNNKADKSKRELPKVQSAIIDIIKPVPVVDTIREEEKYGNTGDKFNKVGRSVVTGVETLGNLINKALNFPMDAVKKLSRSTTEALNNLGGKLVGLQ